MDKKFISLKEELTQTLIKEQGLQDTLKENTLQKEKILDKLLPYIVADVYSGDCFMLKKDYQIDYKLKDPELKDYLKEKSTALDLPRIKRAIKAGMVFTNVKIIPKLIAFKKRNGLQEISRIQKNIS